MAVFPVWSAEHGPADAGAVGAGVSVGDCAYPSAFHVAWTPPPAFGFGRLTALAVDVAPTVFWDGVDPPPADLLEDWKSAVGSNPDRHGTARAGLNGPSGDGLNTEILRPLVSIRTRSTFTNAWKSFFVKHGPNSQGAAIIDRFNPAARQLGLIESTLPPRPSARQLVTLVATSERRD